MNFIILLCFLLFSGSVSLIGLGSYTIQNSDKHSYHKNTGEIEIGAGFGILFLLVCLVFYYHVNSVKSLNSNVYQSSPIYPKTTYYNPNFNYGM